MMGFFTVFAVLIDLCKKHGKGSLGWILFFLLVCISVSGLLLTIGVDIIGREVQAKTQVYEVKTTANRVKIESFDGRVERMETRINTRFDKQDQILMKILTK